MRENLIFMCVSLHYDVYDLKQEFWRAIGYKQGYCVKLQYHRRQLDDYKYMCPSLASIGITDGAVVDYHIYEVVDTRISLPFVTESVRLFTSEPSFSAKSIGVQALARPDVQYPPVQPPPPVNNPPPAKIVTVSNWIQQENIDVNIINEHPERSRASQPHR